MELPPKTDVVSELDAQAKALNIDLDISTDTMESNVDDDTAPVAEPVKSEESLSDKEPKPTKDEVPDDDDEKVSPPPDEPPREPNEDKAFRRIHKQQTKVDQLKEEFNSKIDKLTSLVEKALTSKSPEAIEKAKDDVELYAEKHNLDLNQVKDLVDIVEKRFDAKAPKLTPKVESPKEITMDDKDQQVQFKPEWDTFTQETILDQFPDATVTQVAKMRNEMFKLSHQKENLEKSLDTIFSEKQTVFKDLVFVPKKKSAESGLRHSDTDPTPTFADDYDAEINSVEDATSAQVALDTLIDNTPVIMRRGGQNIAISR